MQEATRIIEFEDEQTWATDLQCTCLPLCQYGSQGEGIALRGFADGLVVLQEFLKVPLKNLRCTEW